MPPKFDLRLENVLMTMDLMLLVDSLGSFHIFENEARTSTSSSISKDIRTASIIISIEGNIVEKSKAPKRTLLMILGSFAYKK
jgi:hypothetical protein